MLILRHCFTIVVALVFLSIFVLPSTMLPAIGWHYTSADALVLFKLHPSTYLLLALSAYLMVSKKPVVISGKYLLANQVWWFLLIITIVMVFLTLLHGAVMLSTMIDSVVRAVFIIIICAYLDEKQKQLIFKLIMIAVICNGMLAIIENMTGYYFYPYYLGERLIDYEQRSRAIMGHPLNNSYICLLAILLTPYLTYNRLLRIILVCFCFIILLAFGGRTALAVAIVLYALKSLIIFSRQVYYQRVSHVQVALSIIAIVFVPLIIILLLFHTGFGEVLANRLHWEDSAQARLDAFKVFNVIDIKQVLFGMNQTQFENLTFNLLKFSVAIENGWLAMLVLYGGFCFILVMIALAMLLVYACGNPSIHRVFLCIAFVIINASYNGISAKVPILVILVLFLELTKATKLGIFEQTHLKKRGIYAI